MTFYVEEFDNQVFGIRAASRGAVVACQELLQSRILAGYRGRPEPEYRALARGYEAVLRSKLCMALALGGQYDASLKEGHAAYALASRASFTHDLTPGAVVEMIAIDAAVITYCGKGNAPAAIALLEGVQRGRGKWSPYALSVLGRILIETGQIETGVARLNEALRRGIDGPTASRQAAAVVRTVEARKPLPKELKLNIQLLVADSPPELATN